MNTFYNAEFSKFPEPVANTLRRAIYYTNVKSEPELALKYYKKAMQQCAEVGLDPFSDEVLGIRIQVAFWLEKIGSHRAAVDVLESILNDCHKWVEVMEISAKEGKINASGFYANDEDKDKDDKTQQGAKSASKDSGKVNKDVAKKDTADESDVPETLWRKRERLLAKAVGTSVKLGELYADEHILQPDLSQKRLVWAVETALKEFRRRKVEGAKPGEKQWLSPEEMGGSMESLGRDYERKSQFDLAVPLFFQALRLCKDPCHRVVIMNNLAAAFAQYPVSAEGSTNPSATLKELATADLPTTRQGCIEAAENWAKNAYTHAKDVKGDERTTECDEGCAVALCNWGDVAAMMGKTNLARRKYTECVDMSTKLGYTPGVEQARQRLAELSGKD